MAHGENAVYNDPESLKKERGKSPRLNRRSMEIMRGDFNRAGSYDSARYSGSDYPKS
jgi:hypothetical protein